MQNAAVRYMQGDTSVEVSAGLHEEIVKFMQETGEKDYRTAWKKLYAKLEEEEVRAYAQPTRPRTAASWENANIELDRVARAFCRAEGIPYALGLKRAIATNPGLGQDYLGHPPDPEFVMKYAMKLEKKARRYDAAGQLNKIILAFVEAGYTETEAQALADEKFPDVVRQAEDDWIEKMATRKVGQNPPFGMATPENLAAARREVLRENPSMAAARDTGRLNTTALRLLLPKLEQVA